MKGKIRNFLVGLCGVLATFGLMVGIFATQPTVEASAATTPTVTMLTGASARKTDEPGIKFTAKIDNYRSDWSYGMLILPEAAWKTFDWDNDTDYLYELFEELGLVEGYDYANQGSCTVYTDEATGERRISFSLHSLKEYNYSMGFVGVAYTYEGDSLYDLNGDFIKGIRYADVNMEDNARSIAYVAQMALKYEEKLTSEQKNALNSYASAGLVLENEEGNPSYSGMEVTEGNYAMKYIFNAAGETVSQITKTAYAGGSEVSFKYYIPAGTVTSWWGIAWHTDSTKANIYHAAGAENPVGYQALGSTTGVWVDVSFTLPAGGPYYLYFGSEVGAGNGRWLLNGENAYALIDDFKVGSATESFSKNTSEWAFTVLVANAVEAYEIEKANIGFGAAEQELGAKIYINKISSDAKAPTFITKEAYTFNQTTTVAFDYYMSGNTNNKWWTLAWTNDKGSASIYAHVENNKENNNAKDLPTGVQDTWATASVEVPAGTWYFYIAGAVGEWGDGYVIVDNFKIGNQVTETFSKGLKKSIFDVNKAEAVVESEGRFVVADDTDYMLAFEGNAIGGKENIAMITDKAYSGVSEITFKAKWTGEAKTSRWGLSYTTNPSKFAYDDGKTPAEQVTWINCYTPRFGELKLDAGVVYTYRLTIVNSTWTMYANDAQLATGTYFENSNYFYFMLCPAVSDGETFYLDDFSITYAGGTEVDTFANSTSSLFVESVQKNADHGSAGMSFKESIFGEGYVAPELGELSMKYLFNVSGETVSQVTKQAYAGGSEVSFKYYIPAGTATQWWGLVWSTSNTGLDIYSAANAGTAHAITGSNTVTGEWKDVSFTLPTGGPYYLYFGSEVGHWTEGSYMLIDNFKVGDETETFNYGVDNSIFSVLKSGTVTDGEGWEPINGAYGAKLTIDLISSTATTPSFITANTYAGGVTVTFDYYISGNTNNKWWTFNWTSNNKQASIYAFVETSDVNFGTELNAKVQDTWVTASVEVPTGNWYFYFAGAVGEWSGGYVIIDNFAIDGEVVENFNNGEYGIFLDNRDSKPDAITIAEGKEEFVSGEYSAQLDFTNSFDNDAKTFITKEAYAGGSTVSFLYMIPEETTVGDWWSINWTTNAGSPDFWAVGNGAVEGCGGINPNPNKNKGQGWVEYSFTLPAGGPYYLYFCGYNNWNGCVYIDNFKVGSVTETFNEEEIIFNLGNAYVSRGEGCTDQGDNGGDVELDVNSFAYKLAEGTLAEFLTSGGYASVDVFNGITLSNDKLAASMLFVDGSFKYTIVGEKEFAIWFGNGYCLFIDGTTVALYNVDGKSEMSSIAVEDGNEHELRIAITSGGKINVKLDGADYVGLGVMESAVKGMKLVAVSGSGSVYFENIAFESWKVSLSGIPVYFSEETIDFTAYAFDSSAMISEAGFQLLSDAGFTKTLALLQGRLSAGDLHEQDIPNRAHVENLMAEVNADAMAALELAEKFGMKHYVLNSNLYNIERNPNNYQWIDDFAELATYTMSEAFAGHFLADEPQSGNLLTDDELEELVDAYKAYKAAFPEGEAFINLLPRGSTQFWSESAYTNYVQSYIDNIALDKNGVKGTGYVSFDHYPLEDSGITSTHLRNLEIVAEKCRDNNLELRTYIKASESGDSEREIRATESINDLYMQIYSALAYGSKEIIYYQFTDHTKTDGTVGDAVISGMTLDTTAPVYQFTKQANNEVAAFGRAYMNFTWKSASVFGKTSLTQFNNLKNKAGAYGSLAGVSSSASVLVGNFDDADGSYTYGAKNAYMVVNYGNTDNVSHATSAITMSFNGIDRVLIYENGVARVERLSGNNIVLELEMGEGAFVIPLTDNY